MKPRSGVSRKSSKTSHKPQSTKQPGKPDKAVGKDRTRVLALFDSDARMTLIDELGIDSKTYAKLKAAGKVQSDDWSPLPFILKAAVEKLHPDAAATPFERLQPEDAEMAGLVRKLRKLPRRVRAGIEENMNAVYKRVLGLFIYAAREDIRVTKRFGTHGMDPKLACEYCERRGLK